MTDFYVEITDTFGGEANYSWVTHHRVTASTMRGAMWRVARDSGLSWHIVGDYGDVRRYDSRSGATCAFITEWNDADHSERSRVSTDLAH